MNKFKKINILSFIFLVFFCLIIQILYINRNTVSVDENRNLANYITFYNSKSKTFNFNFGKDFENWLKDRFLFRNQMIHLYKRLTYTLSIRYARCGTIFIDKHKKEMFYYNHVFAYGNEKINNFSFSVKSFDNYCKKNNIRFYIVVVPDKEMVYTPPETVDTKSTRLVNQLKTLKTIYGINIIFPINELIKAKNENPYLLAYKADSHYTPDGIYIVYKALMQQITKDFPNVKVVQPNEFNYFYSKLVCAERERTFSYGNLCNMAALTKKECNKFHDINYRYYKHKDIAYLTSRTTEKKYLKKRDYHYAKGNKFNVMVFGESYAENLMDILPYSFKNTSMIRLNGPDGIQSDTEKYKIIKYYENEIRNYKPDILILFIGRSIEHFVNLTNKN